MSSIRGPKAQLLVILDGSEFRVVLEGTVTAIGSDPECTLSLKDGGIEPRHCMIQQTENGYEIFDLFTESGTQVNGERIEAHELRTGDSISIGKIRIVYLETPRPAGSAAPGPASPQPKAIPLERDPWESWQEEPFFERDSEPPAPDVSHPAPSPVDTPDDNKHEEPSSQSKLLSWREKRAAAKLRRAEKKERQRTEKERARARRDGEETARQQLAAATLVPTVDPRSLDQIIQDHQRFHRTGFNDVLVEQLRSTPYMALSFVIHVCLAIILHLIASQGPERKPLPRYAAEFEHQDLASLDEIDIEPPMDVDPEVEPDDLPPEVVEPLEPVVDYDPEKLIEPDKSKEEIEGPPLERFESGIGSGGEGLEGLGGPGGASVGGKGFRKYVRGLRKSGLDIVIVIDSTGSMGGVINDARRQVDRMIATVASLVPTFRLGVVTYRDRGDDYVTRESTLTPHYYQAVDFLDRLEAEGGNDIPEAVHDGLKRAIRTFRWGKGAKRVVVLVGDAPPHDGDVQDIRGLVSDFSRRNGAVHTLVTASDSFGGNPRPDQNAIRAFRSIASSGKGVAVELKNSSQVVRKIIEIALGEEHKGDIAKAIGQMESGWRSRRYRRMIEKRDLHGVYQEMRKKPAPQLLFRELGRKNDIAFLPVYLHTLESKDATAQARWAAAVLARRSVVIHVNKQPRRRRGAQRLLRAAGALTAGGPPSRIRSLVRDLKTVAAEARLPVQMPAQDQK